VKGINPQFIIIDEWSEYWGDPDEKWEISDEEEEEPSGS
jgi:hypothetical protein